MSIFKIIPSTLFIGLTIIMASPTVVAAEVHIAVAANFAEPMKTLKPLFEQSSGHQVIVSIGSTGQLYSQVKNGAPFEVFLSADMTTPQKLMDDELVVKGSRFIYAIGKLVLWSKDANLVDKAGQVLKTGKFNHLAIANPQTAPYGTAAKQVLDKLGLWQILKEKLVQANSITQAYQFVATGTAELGFIALSQYQIAAKETPGSHWLVPEQWYETLLQGAVLLKKGENNPVAKTFMAFLSTPQAQTVIKSYGYSLP